MCPQYLYDPISTSAPSGDTSTRWGTWRGPNVGLWVQQRWVAISLSVHSTVPLVCRSVLPPGKVETSDHARKAHHVSVVNESCTKLKFLLFTSSRINYFHRAASAFVRYTDPLRAKQDFCVPISNKHRPQE